MAITYDNQRSLTFEEMQIFDRKSVKIEPKALAIPLIAFVNADGGTIAIGISDSERRIEGTDYEIKKVNGLLTVPCDFNAYRTKFSSACKSS